MRKSVPGVLAVLAVVLAGSLSRAGMVTRRWGSPPTGGPTKGPRTPLPVGYAPSTPAAPTIDGDLSDACWARAPRMLLARTLQGAADAAQPTEVRALHDAKALYLAIRCVELAGDKVRASRRGHDGAIWSDDSVEMFLGVGGTYYHFGVNAAGSTYDGKVKDSAWNSGLRAAATKGSKQWTAELAIPLGKLVGKGKPHRGKPPREWTANFNRNRYTAGSLQESAWSPTLSGDSHVPARFGKLLLADPPKPEGPKPAVTTGSVTVVPVEGGEGVVRFKLAGLPEGAKIYRADLLVFRTVRLNGGNDEAATNVDIRPLPAGFKAVPGGPVKSAGKALRLRGPWFDRLDATDAVRQAAAGKPGAPEVAFFVKACPFIDLKATCLDVAYEGKPGKLPPQVTAVQAFHNAGQTFITFKEIDDPVASDTVPWGQLKRVLDGLDRNRRVRYCVYRSDRPITAANLHQAELLARVKPLSGWNVNGRSLDKAIDQKFTSPDTIFYGQWNPFSRASMDGRYGSECLMERLVVRDGGKPLPRGTGLYVHTAGRKGRSCYAVVTSVDGVENTVEVSAGNSLASPVAETSGQGVPVLQKEFPPRPFFNYEEKRLHYVRWVAPPYGNLPCQYYNWGVGVPGKHGKAMPLELSLHRDGRSYYRTQYRLESDSLVLSPHDFPVETWWYGYHESLGTLKSFRQGLVHNYTERRLLAFIDWAAKQWPVDRKRVLVTGCGGGGAGGGALHLGIRHPEVFNLVLSGYGQADYRGDLAALISVKRAGTMPARMHAIWGKVEWDLKTDTGKSVWDELNLTRIVRGLPDKADLPMVTVTGHGMLQPMRDFFVAMLERGRPFMCRYGVYGGGTLMPISTTGKWSRMIRMDVRKDVPLPAFRGPYAASLFVDPKEPSGNLVVSDGIKRWWGDINTGCRWKTGDLVDSPARFEVTLYWAGSSRVRSPQADVTLRRIQKFRLRAGRDYRYELRNPAGEVLRKGTVNPGASGVLAFKAVPLPREGVRLVVMP